MKSSLMPQKNLHNLTDTTSCPRPPCHSGRLRISREIADGSTPRCSFDRRVGQATIRPQLTHTARPRSCTSKSKSSEKLPASTRRWVESTFGKIRIPRSAGESTPSTREMLHSSENDDSSRGPWEESSSWAHATNEREYSVPKGNSQVVPRLSRHQARRE
jgi:hypothetical protein